jgi:hypothetical protein
VDGAGHNDLAWVAGDSEGSLLCNRYSQALRDFAQLLRR